MGFRTAAIACLLLTRHSREYSRVMSHPLHPGADGGGGGNKIALLLMAKQSPTPAELSMALGGGQHPGSGEACSTGRVGKR